MTPEQVTRRNAQRSAHRHAHLEEAKEKRRAYYRANAERLLEKAAARKAEELGPVKHAVLLSTRQLQEELRLLAETWMRQHKRDFVWGRSSWRLARKLKLVIAMGGCCQRCLHEEFVASLLFHHVDPAIKERGLNSFVERNMHAAKLEADKCVLLCANCHAAFHAGEWTGTFVKRLSLGWTLAEPELLPR